MTNPEKLQFKNQLKQSAMDLISSRIAAARQAMDQAQESANQEEKSSAGDKYETGRAMGHLQKEMHSRQLAENLKELATLQAVNADALYSTAQPGAYIQCQGAAFFIAAGLGKQTTAGQTVYFLSPQAPLAGALQGRKAGDQLTFNGKQLSIFEIW